MPHQAEKTFKKKVAIVGSAPHMGMAPYEDHTWELWGVNIIWDAMPRWDRFFQLHSLEEIENDTTRDPKEVLDWLKTDHGRPVYMVKDYPQFPSCVAYPLAEIKEQFKFGRTRKPPFTNSISFMIALAIREGFEEIGVWGVDMADDTEYADQKPSVTYFMGIVDGMGLKLTLPEESDLLSCRYLYGFEEDGTFSKKLWVRTQELTARKKDIEAKHKEMEAALNYYQGALDDLDYFKNNW